MSDAQSRWTDAVGRYDVPHLRLRQVAALVEATGAARVTDVGCGPGYLRTLLPPGTEYVGCDFVAPARPVDFDLHLCDLNHQPLPALPAADAVVCSGILEYIVDLDQFLVDLRHLATPGGTLVASYFNMNHASRVWALARGRTPPFNVDWTGFHAPAEVRARLTRAGWTVTRMVASSQGVRPSPAVGDTVTETPRLRDAGRLSRWTAHQFIYVARPS